MGGFVFVVATTVDGGRKSWMLGKSAQSSMATFFSRSLTTRHRPVGRADVAQLFFFALPCPAPATGGAPTRAVSHATAGCRLARFDAEPLGSNWQKEPAPPVTWPPMTKKSRCQNRFLVPSSSGSNWTESPSDLIRRPPTPSPFGELSDRPSPSLLHLVFPPSDTRHPPRRFPSPCPVGGDLMTRACP